VWIKQAAGIDSPSFNAILAVQDSAGILLNFSPELSYFNRLRRFDTI